MAGPGSRREVEALAAEGAAFVELCVRTPEPDWFRPSRCQPMDFRLLGVHLTAQLEYLASIRDQSFVDSEPQKDRLSWWDYDISEDQAETLVATQRNAKDFPEGAFPERVRAAVDAAVEAVEFRLTKGDPVVLAGSTAIRLNDYVATRVLELTIHAMDLRDALGLEPSPTQQGLAVTGDILRARLAADPRPSVTDERLCLIGTGRADPTAEEAAALGDLIQKLPLLA